MREFAADLIRRKVAVIVTGGRHRRRPGCRGRNENRTHRVHDRARSGRERAGWESSIGRGANVTGVTFIGSEIGRETDGASEKSLFLVPPRLLRW